MRLFVPLILIVLSLGSAKALATLSWSSQSSTGELKISLSPISKKVKVGEYSSWHLGIHDQNGAPIRNAGIALSVGMFGEGHGHGMPSSPQVTEEVAPGIYLVEGLFFNMFGAWTFFVDIKTSSRRDKARIDLDINAAD